MLNFVLRNLHLERESTVRMTKEILELKRQQAKKLSSVANEIQTFGAFYDADIGAKRIFLRPFYLSRAFNEVPKIQQA